MSSDSIHLIDYYLFVCTHMYIHRHFLSACGGIEKGNQKILNGGGVMKCDNEMCVKELKHGWEIIDK